MATIDYKDKYEKAVQTAMLAKQDTESAVTIGILEEIFPELKESEDERIRKEIIATIHLYYGEPLENEAKEMIAWLENQGEQNPAWSEEDEMLVHGLIRGLAAKRDIHGHTTFSSDCIDITKTIDWLKSLKDRIQPKQEWSEEDDSMVEDVRNSFEFHCDEMTEALQEQYNKFFDKVKSLRPQNRWKPSDEQMEVLLSEVTGWTKGCPKQIVLESLYNDLKKLK